jgi:hypothetical protein
MSSETHSHILDGTVFRYTYIELGTVVVEFYKGLVSFEWLDGALCGEVGEDFPYRAKQLNDHQFIANWHEPEARGFVTIFIDLSQRKVYSSVLASYATEDEQIWLHEARLHEFEGVT